VDTSELTSKCLNTQKHAIQTILSTCQLDLSAFHSALKQSDWRPLFLTALSEDVTGARHCYFTQGSERLSRRFCPKNGAQRFLRVSANITKRAYFERKELCFSSRCSYVRYKRRVLALLEDSSLINVVFTVSAAREVKNFHVACHFVN